MRRAIELLPPELKPFFEKYQRRDRRARHRSRHLAQRRVGRRSESLPGFRRARSTARIRFRRCRGSTAPRWRSSASPTLKRNGLLPWREAEEFGNLRRAFEEFKREAPYTTSNVVLFSAVASHYIQDAHQPFHATDNYDGQQTGNAGIHSRFERDLIERYEARLKLDAGAGQGRLAARATPRSRRCSASYLLVDPILKADKEALGSSDTYDDEYFEKFFAKVQPMLEQQLSAAITATASVIVSAWDQAGRPTSGWPTRGRSQKVRPPR